MRATAFSAALALLASGCGLGLDDEWTAELEPVDMGVDVRLEAVTWDIRTEHLFAVGSGGVVVDDLGHRWDLPGTLRDVIVTGGDKRPTRLIVVGDHGFVAIAKIDGDVVGEFEVVDVGTQNNLHAVIGGRHSDYQDTLIVGDDTLIMASEGEQGELVWTHPPAPPDGWGKLRDVSFPSGLSSTPCALGKAGRMLCAHEVALDEWVWEVVPLDTDANLTSFCGGHGFYAVGEDGVLLAGDIYDDWIVVELDPAIDFVGCTSMFYYPVLVGSDRTIYTWQFDELDPLVTLDWEPRGADPSWGTAIVGDSGHAGIFHITSGIIPQ